MIEINKLTFGYGKNRLFDGLDLELGAGHICGLLGKNGAGKSTLLKLITGLLFEDKGTIRVGKYIPRERKPSFLNNIFFIPEEFYFPKQTMKRYAKLNSPFYPNFSEDNLFKNAKEFDLDLTQRLDRMSLGQKKKALICFGLACQTQVLIMDEPTNGLDIPSKSQFRKIVASSVKSDRTIIISTHQVRDLEQLIDSVVIIDDSKILLNQNISNITNKLYFGTISTDEHPIYSENGMRGIVGVRQNTYQEESKLDMEMLFNTVVNAPKEINNIFGTQQN